MRVLVIGLLVLAGCDRNAGDREPTLDATPAAFSFDGADYKEEAAKIAHGERLTKVLGCSGCHGKQFEGNVWVDSPEEGLLHASNLTRALPGYSDEQLVRLLREGVHPTGREVWGMPSELFQHLSKSDETALIAYLRTLKPTGEPSPLPKLGPLTKELVAKGEIKPAAEFVRESKNIGPIDLGPSHALARYITRVTCAECHGPELKGREGGSPDLVAAGAYTRDEFETMITQGVLPGGRKFKNELMASVAKSRFSQLTKHERDALYAYLKARAEQPQ